METLEQQQYLVRWNNYTEKIVTSFQLLRDKEDFVDVTVACDGHSYSAHKMVLSAYSTFFHSLLRASPCQHPIVILKDVCHTEMERLLEFMYNGEVNIAQDQLAAFLKTAESLKIRGLAGSSDDFDQSQLENSHNGTCALSVCKDKIDNISESKCPAIRFNSNHEDKNIKKIKEEIFQPISPSKSKRRKRTSGIPVTSQADNSSSQILDNLTRKNLNNNGSDLVNANHNHNMDEDLDEELKSESLHWIFESTANQKFEPSNSLRDVDIESAVMNPNQHLEDSAVVAFLNLLDVSQKIEPCHRCGSIMQVKRKRDRGGDFRPVLRCPRNGCQTTRSFKKIYNK